MKIGLIGCGRVAHLHMLAYKSIPHLDVVSVADLNIDLAKDFANKYKIEVAIDDSDKILENKNLDFIDICTPTSTHMKISCDAAKLGHNILLEKPMARTSMECNEIIKEVEKQGVKLSVCHNQLFIPQVMEAKALVDSGEFPLDFFKTSVRENAEIIGAPEWILTPKHGGVLWETGAHCAYLQLHFLDEIIDITAMGRQINHEVHEHFIALLKNRYNKLGVIDVSWLANNYEIVFELISSYGKTIRIINYDYPLYIPDSPNRMLQGLYRDQKMIYKKWIKATLNNLKYYNVSCVPQFIMFNKFIDSIKHETELPVTPQDGKKTVMLLEFIQKSMETNIPIKF